MRICKLPPLLSNQIAAGEVIERPGSVVKELLENSLDAGSSQIELLIHKGGSKLIKLRDNGHGIDREDLPLAMARHATSKIYSLADLEKINSLGFRGEALSSISSISRFALISKSKNQDHAWKIEVEGHDQETTILPDSHPQGTTVCVQDLFFNTPARRKFLRAEKTEFFQIEEVVKRIALSRFDIHIRLDHNDRQILNLSAADSELARDKRVTKIFGSQFMKHALKIDIERIGLRLWGWLALPDFFRSQSDMQYFYLNGRMVKDRMINHAVRQAYQDMLFQGRQPAYVLYLELDPSVVDVNVHPTKHEVRFHESRMVHDFLFSTLNKFLRNEQSIEIAEAQTPLTKNYSTPRFLPSQVKPQISAYETLSSESKQKTSMFGQTLSQLKQTYLLTENEQGFALIKISDAKKAVISHRYQRAFSENKVISQPLLIPFTMTLDERDPQCLIHYAESLQNLGLMIERMGDAALVIRQIPIYLKGINHEALLSALCEYFNALDTKDLSSEKTLQLIELMVNVLVKTSEPSLDKIHENELLNDLEMLSQNEDKGRMKGMWKQLTLQDFHHLFTQRNS